MAQSVRKRIISLAGRFAFILLSGISSKLNPSRITRWGGWLGDMIYICSRRYRGVAIRNLSLSFPDWSTEKVKQVARETCRNFARGALEFFYLIRLSPEHVDDWVSMEGAEYLDAAIAEGRGAIIVTAHYGNWELFARKIVLHGLPLNVIARDSDDAGMTGIANRIRESAGYRVLSRDNAALPALRRLKKNELLGILPDQNSYTGVMVDFFGRPAMTATGPAVFALRSGAPIVCGFCRRTEDGRFKCVIYPPLDVPRTGDEETDTRALTAAITSAIEDEIRKDPAQWLWLHSRWKRAEDILAGTVKE